MAAAVEVEDLVKTYGTTRALDGVTLQVPQGGVLGLLGPNGAGKTTTVRVLTTLLRPDSGRASVLGIDVLKDPDKLRRIIGVAGQYAAVDELLTGRENLVLVGKLYHLPKAEITRRADELLERFELTAAASRVVKGYSGGMRRRLDLAASLVNRPQVLFLDEPTTGLDPRSRLRLWEVIEDLVRDGTTLLLTTQYLEEADRLADRIAVIDTGKVIAEGTSDELKDRVGGSVVVVRPANSADGDRAFAALSTVGEPVRGASGDLTLPATTGVTLVTEAARVLEEAGIAISELALRRPTLDDVFLTLTGHAAEQAEEQSA
ncbi:MAG: daunorubicin/doxorubicin resistance transporter ATP-binding protein DrrA [Frankiales bacterium]|jgi:ABC-2 type transport system ATP-binding protein|nr:daunorubicin/doxorubicin resistance transporter ATP-binding protein DrrA [Frankiales bacterium]